MNKTSAKGAWIQAWGIVTLPDAIREDSPASLYYATATV
jgi:hypothetical protein